MSDTGFWYATSQNNLQSDNNKVNTGSTASPFNKVISNLSANTIYYYQAWVAEYNASTSSVEVRSGDVESFRTKAVATATASNSAASSVSSSGATLNGSYTGATGAVSATGFYYGTTSSNLQSNGIKVTTGSTSASFSKTITGLTANTTYYYKAFVVEANENTGTTEERLAASAASFTTSAVQTTLGWLELPARPTAVDYVGTFKAGTARNYTYFYDYDTYTALCVAYPLYSGTLGSGYSASWKENPNVDDQYEVNCWTASYNVNYGETNWSSTQGSEYYARGHQIPNADRSGNSTMQSQTYYSTNSTPQIQNKFNASIWSTLEGDVRTVASATDTVYVITGAAFRKVGFNESITYIHPKADENKSVPVPNYYWKALLKVKWNGNNVTSASAIGVWLPHQQYNSNDYSSYVVSVDQIESWTGFDLFTNLPTALQSTAEANTNWNTFSDF